MDGINFCFLKSGANVLAKPLAFIFQLSLQSGIVPDEWKGGVIHDPNQYRPISVISTVLKIYERIVHNQFSHILTVNDCLAQEQSGFRLRHSTQTALLDVSDFLLKQILNRLKNVLPIQTINLIVKSLIFPQFDYCDLIWSNASKTLIQWLDVLLNRAGRTILKVPSRTSASAVRSELHVG